MNNLITLGAEELERAKKKHDWSGLTELEKVAVLTNEVGEALQAAVKWKKDPNQDANLKAELIQTQAMLMRVWEELGFGDFKSTVDERLCEVRKGEPYKSHPYLQGVEDEAWVVTAFNEPEWVEDENHITVDGVRYVAVEEIICDPCEIFGHCNKLVCSQLERTDRRNVVWKRA